VTYFTQNKQIQQIKRSDFVCPHHASTYREHRYRYTLTSAPGGHQWLTSCPGHFNPDNESWYPLNRRQGEAQSRSECLGKEEKYLFLPVFEPMTNLPVEQSLY
jgi:hypothetical protein